MKKPGTATESACWLALLTAIAPSTAYAYLDPGFASLVLQAIIGTVSAAAVVASLYWRRFVGFFKRKKKPTPEEKETSP